MIAERRLGQFVLASITKSVAMRLAVKQLQFDGDDMSRELSSSQVARQNVLNNRYALEKLQEHLALGGLQYEGEVIFTKAQVAEILQVDERTIDRYLTNHGDELKSNDYRILKGKALRNIKLANVDDINVVDIVDSKGSRPCLREILIDEIVSGDFQLTTKAAA